MTAHALGDEQSLVITDIVVELEDGTIANIEVQKIGYSFTGERSSCYSADLLLRQYKRLRDQNKKNFTYKDMAPVYTIVFLESSPKEFKAFTSDFVHKFKIVSDTGIELKMLQNFIFVPIDIFLNKMHNEGIQSTLDAWLTFLGCDEPKYIATLIQKYPYFKPLYDDLYEMCLNTEGVMNMFSKELQIADHNTVTYMIDEMKAEIDAKNREIDAKDRELAKKDAAYATTIADKDAAIADKDKLIVQLQLKLKELEDSIS